MRPEYDIAQLLKAAVRGKYAARLAAEKPEQAHAEGYARQPQDLDELADWESLEDWDHS